MHVTVHRTSKETFTHFPSTVRAVSKDKGRVAAANSSKAIGAHIPDHEALKPGPKTSEQDKGRVAAAKHVKQVAHPSLTKFPIQCR
jgi:hypothetical protein